MTWVPYAVDTETDTFAIDDGQREPRVFYFDRSDSPQESSVEIDLTDRLRTPRSAIIRSYQGYCKRCGQPALHSGVTGLLACTAPNCDAAHNPKTTCPRWLCAEQLCTDLRDGVVWMRCYVHGWIRKALPDETTATAAVTTVHGA